MLILQFKHKLEVFYEKTEYLTTLNPFAVNVFDINFQIDKLATTN